MNGLNLGLSVVCVNLMVQVRVGLRRNLTPTAFAQFIEMLVSVTKNSPSRDYSHPDN